MNHDPAIVHTELGDVILIWALCIQSRSELNSLIFTLASYVKAEAADVIILNRAPIHTQQTTSSQPGYVSRQQAQILLANQQPSEAVLP